MTSLCNVVVRAVGRTDEQSQEQGGHGGDHAHGQFHDVPGIGAQVVFGQKATQEHPQAHGGKEGG